MNTSNQERPSIASIWPPAPVLKGLRMAVVERSMQFRVPAQTSRDTLTSKPSFFLVAEDSHGRIGVGECSLIPGLSMESVAEARGALEHLASCGTLDAMSVPPSLPAVRFAVETAAWDLAGGGEGTLVDSPFARGESHIDINGLVWMNTLQEMASQFDTLVQHGFRTLKCKVGALDWEGELSMLAQVRKQHPSPDFTLRVDANGAFSALSLKETFQRLESLAELGIHSIEQPLKPHDVDGLATLSQEAILPIALDESLIGVHNLSERMRLLDRIAPQFLVLKPSLVGGLDSATIWSRLAEQRGIGWWVTSALESNVGLNAIAQWASVQPALSTNSPALPQGLGTGGLFLNNTPSNLMVDRGALLVKGPVRREESLWREALKGAKRHEPSCHCGHNHRCP